MILKIRAVDRWCVIDNIDEVRYRSLPLEKDKVGTSKAGVNTTYIIDPKKTEQDVKTREIIYQKNGKTQFLFFNTIAYLCNNEGKTIETI